MMSNEKMPGGGATLASRYSRLETDRQPYLLRARASSALTIPPLFPRQGTTAVTNFKTCYQSLGARAVNSLASKLVLAVLPANQSFFRFDPDDKTINRIQQQVMAQVGPVLQTVSDPNQAAQIKAQAEEEIENQTKRITEGLAKMERTVQKDIESSTLRAKISELIKQLIVGGNSLLYVESPKKARVFRLDSYVVHLDAMGNLLELIVKEKVSILTLTEEIISARRRYKRFTSWLPQRTVLKKLTH